MSNLIKLMPASGNSNRWAWGFTPEAEIWNGRFAMIGFLAVLLIELVYGRGLLYLWNLFTVNALAQ